MYIWENSRIFTNMLMLKTFSLASLVKEENLEALGLIISWLKRMNSWLTSFAGLTCEPLSGWSPGREQLGASEQWHRRSQRLRLVGSERGDETVKASLCEPPHHAAPAPGQQSGWSSDVAGCARQCQAPRQP